MKTHPNILMICTDHLAQRAVGAYGDPQRRTPNIDALAGRGTRFANAYTPCPICMPARASFWTGRLPHETGIRGNTRQSLHVPETMPTLGDTFAHAGYECVHYGKTHDMGGLRAFGTVESGCSAVPSTAPWTSYGDTQEDRSTTEKAVAYLERQHEKPFLLVADYNNPHDICLWIGDHAGAHTDEPLDTPLPELPHNFEDADRQQRPVAARRNCCVNGRVGQTLVWTPLNFRHYLAAFYHYVELVDREIGAILQALEKRGDADNTLVLLFSDHGESMASHRLVTKGGHFYEETVRVPLIFAGPGVAAVGEEAAVPLTSLVDLLPTLCDVAGVDPPGGLSGASLRPWLRDPRAEGGPEYVVSTWHGGGECITPARMLRTARYKYASYKEDNSEELYDVAEDPGETRTLVFDPAHERELERHRELLRKHCARTGDTFFEDKVVVPEGFRNHPDKACPF